MAGEKMGFDAEISIVVKGAKDAISTLENLRGVSADLDKQIDKMQRSLAGAVSGIEKVGAAAGGSTKGLTAQKTALQGLIGEYNALQKSATKAAAAQGPVGSAASLGRQKAAELETARLEQKKFNDYVTASNARMAQAELKSVQDTQKAVRREREATAKATAAAAKKAQNDAFSSYSGNMPAAVKAQQKAAYDSYASNIRHTQSQQQLNDSLSNTRYALYDVASTMAVVTAATLGMVVAVEKVGIEFERSFANVERTSGAVGSELQSLRDELVNISTTMPVAFGDVTQIATLGGQLGVAKDELGAFSQTISQFSATTNVSLDSAATGLGRLSQLTENTGSFDQYASAIYEVGINSVATEEQILSVAQQIAVSGNLAGFSADQIIGLSGALASLGVKPEMARGSVMRILREIGAAAEEGGEKLELFGKLSGMSAQEFSDSWQSEAGPQEAFTALINGMGKAAEGGTNLDGILADLGLKAVRDQQAIKLLADNTEVYAQALADSSGAFEEGTALSEGYSIVAETLSARLQVLVNTLKAIADSVSQLDAVKGFVEILQSMAEAALEWTKTPVGGTIALIVLGLGALVGVAAAAGTAYALLTASGLALRTANINLAASSGVARTGIGLLAREMATMAGVATRATIAQTAFNTAVTGGASKAAATAVGARALVGGMAALAASAGPAIAVIAAIAGIAKVVDMVSDSMRSSNQIAEDYFGDLSGLSSALTNDTAVFKETGKSIRTITSEVETSKQELAPWAQSLSDAADAQVELNGSTETTTKSVQDQTFAVGENARTWVASQLANDEVFQKMFRNQELLNKIGFDTKSFADSILGSENGGVEYLTTLIGKYAEARAAREEFASPTAKAGYTAQVTQEFNELLETAQAFDSSFGAASTQLEITNEVMGALGANTDQSAAAMDEFGIVTEDANQKLVDLVNSAYEMTGGAVAIQNAVFSLGESMAQNGNTFSQFSENGRANLGALQGVVAAMAAASGGDAAVLAANIAGLMQSLGQFGVSAAGDLLYLQNILNSLTGGKGTQGLPGVNQAAEAAGATLRGGYAKGAEKAAKATEKAGKAAKKAAAEVVTLADYARDLSGVFDRAFDLRFGVSQAQDDVSEIYQNIVDSAEEAAEAMRDAAQAFADSQAKINSLDADNKILSYQLGVAQEYKDALRVAEITAQIGENNAELAEAQQDRADAQKEMTAAQQKGSRVLTGDTEVARENRDTVEGLVSAYQAQITALASSGMSTQQLQTETARLRNQFVTQLTQMGYNRAEVNKYAAAFDDLGRIIATMPRTVTVTANVNPAQQALNEFLAKANASKATATLDAAGGGTYNASGIAVGSGGITAPFLDAFNQIRTPDLWTGKLNASGNIATVKAATGGLIPEYLAAGGVGGMHPGSPSGTDTVPAWLTPGEYVQKRDAVDYYGLPFMNAINNMQVPKYLATGSGAPARASGGISVVELSAVDRALLAAAGNVQITVDGKVLAQTVTGHNSNLAQRGSN